MTVGRPSHRSSARSGGRIGAARDEVVASVQARFRRWADEIGPMSQLYAHIAAGVADDAEVASLLLANEHDEQRIPVLLFAAVHDLALTDPAVPIAAFYRTVVDEPSPSAGAYRAFRSTVLAHRDRVEHSVATRSTQTNEVGRATFYLPAMALVEHEMGPLSLVDVGASGGLNLFLDRFSYRYDGRSVDPADGPSPVVLTCRTDHTLGVPAIPAIAARRGIDREPIDIANPAAARWLEACVWPDQFERFERLRAAIEIAAADPPVLIAADAVDGLAGEVNAATDDGHPVVMNSWVLNYLAADRRARYVEALNELGHDLDLSWVFAESPRETPELPHGSLERPELTLLTLVRWRGGNRTVDHLAICHPHGARISWQM